MPHKKKSTIDEASIRSKPTDFDRFLNSELWYDMRTLIEERIDYLVERLTQSTSTEELIGLKHEIKAWKEMVGLPSYLKQEAHKEQGNQKQEEINFNKHSNI